MSVLFEFVSNFVFEKKSSKEIMNILFTFLKIKQKQKTLQFICEIVKIQNNQYYIIRILESNMESWPLN